MYRYFNDPIPLHQVIAEAKQLEGGGTLAVYLGSHALARGYKATLYTYNLRIFDPTWFLPGNQQVADKLKDSANTREALPGSRSVTEAYLELLNMSGPNRVGVLTASLSSECLHKSSVGYGGQPLIATTPSANDRVGDGLEYGGVEGIHRPFRGCRRI